MRTLCLFGVFGGAVVMLSAIVLYYKVLVRYRSASDEQRLFSHWMYGACYVLMLFFLLGYLGIGFMMLRQSTLRQEDPLVASILFFGAIFVYLVVTVQQRMSQGIMDKADEIVKTLVNAMEAKDPYTRGHSVHVANLTQLFYNHLPELVKHRVDEGDLMQAAILHDIGKIGIQDAILNKPDRLSDQEWDIMRQHPRWGKQILEQTSFRNLSNIILCHHERMDQCGYYGIPPDQIPLESRIIAIADTFSALFSDRVYRPRKTFAESIRILNDCAGTQLDFQLVEYFTQIPEQEILEASRDLFQAEPLHVGQGAERGEAPL